MQRMQGGNNNGNNNSPVPTGANGGGLGMSLNNPTTVQMLQRQQLLQQGFGGTQGEQGVQMWMDEAWPQPVKQADLGDRLLGDGSCQPTYTSIMDPGSHGLQTGPLHMLHVSFVWHVTLCLLQGSRAGSDPTTASSGWAAQPTPSEGLTACPSTSSSTWRACSSCSGTTWATRWVGGNVSWDRTPCDGARQGVVKM